MTCDAERLQPAIDRLVTAGITVADITYRTPRPEGLPIHQSGWEDVQRAVRVVKSEAAKRGFSPEKIGATGISAGAKALLLVATSSETRAYDPVDAIDGIGEGQTPMVGFKWCGSPCGNGADGWACWMRGDGRSDERFVMAGDILGCDASVASPFGRMLKYDGKSVREISKYCQQR